MSKAYNLINNNTVDVDLDLTDLRKKRIRINGDDNKILEINTSDVGVITRLNENSDKLDKISEKASSLSDNNIKDDENFKELAVTLKELDTEMRVLIDDIFQSNVCEICASDGSMFDPINGSTRWEIIVSSLISLYEDTIIKEMEKENSTFDKSKNKQRIHYHTDKYTGKN